MRKAFIRVLSEIVEKDRNTLLITGDLGFSVFEEFKERFPENYLNAGVAEGNMVGMAAGMAMSGKKVFVYSIAPFIVYRAFEQIRDDVSLHNLPVTFIGVGSGLAYGNAGPTHHATEDLALMSSLPNMTVLAPGDPIEAGYATKAAYNLKSPVYIRLNRAGDRQVHPNDISFKIGEGIVLKEGSKMLILATGNMLEVGYDVSTRLEEIGVKTELVSMHTIKPFNQNQLKKLTRNKTLVITLEEHTKYGGLASITALALLDLGYKGSFLPITLPDKFANVSGSQSYLRKLYGIDSDSVYKKIQERLKENDFVS